MPSWIAREATIVDRDVKDAGKDPQRAKDDRPRLCVENSDTQSWTSERRIDEISLSAHAGATWFLHARSSVM